MPEKCPDGKHDCGNCKKVIEINILRRMVKNIRFERWLSCRYRRGVYGIFEARKFDLEIFCGQKID